MAFRYFEASSQFVTAYNKFRPNPPVELIKKIVNYVQNQNPLLQSIHLTAVDIGCGGGQSTEVLAPYFKAVIGVDPSNEQIMEANGNNKNKNVEYRTGSAEKINLPNNSVQLLTAGQSCHWFNLPKFYEEAARILSPGGVIALYGYLLPRPRFGNQQEELCDIVDKYYNKTLGNYVLPESKMVYIENYRGDEFSNIPFVNGEMARDETVSVEQDATLADLIGYISSWSAFQNYQKKEGEKKASEVLKAFEKEFTEKIGINCSPDEINLTIKYNYFLLLGRKL